MSPYFIRSINFSDGTGFVEVIIGDVNDKHYYLELRLNADDFVRIASTLNQEGKV